MSEKQKKNDRDSTIKYDFDFLDGLAQWPASDEKDLILDPMADELAEEFGFRDPPALLEFLYDASEIIRGFSDVKIKNGIVDAPADLSNFSDVKIRVNQLVEKLDDLAELLFAARRDALTEMLLKHFDRDGAIKAYSLATVEVLDVLSRIENLEGRPGKPITPQWIEAFCVHCQKFWLEQKGPKAGTRIMFHNDRQTLISPWVEAVFLKLTREMEMNTPVSALHGVARSIAAYRP